MTEEIQPADAKMLEQVADFCDEMRRLYSEYGKRTKGEAAPGSPAQIEEQAIGAESGPAGQWDSRLAWLVGHRSQRYLFLAVSHLEGLSPMLRAGVPFFPLGPVTRSVAEASSKAMWLVDPRIPQGLHGTRQRGARVMVDSIEGLKRGAETAHDTQQEWAPAAKAKKRQWMKRTSEELFWPNEVDRDKAGDLIVCEQSVPRLEDLVADIGTLINDPGAGGRYAYLCGLTHPNYWAVDEAIEVAESDDPDYSAFRLSVSPQKTARIVLASLLTFHQGWRIYNSWMNPDDLSENEQARQRYNEINEIVGPIS